LKKCPVSILGCGVEPHNFYSLLPHQYSSTNVLKINLASNFHIQFPTFAESLDLLITTLDQASVDPGHIQGLFFLAETALYWLRTDAINR